MSSTVTILNYIRQTATSAYQDLIPLATAENFTQVGEAVLQAPETIRNEFLSALINKVGLQLFNVKEFSNPLIDLKKGEMEYGQTIEDIFIEMAKPFEYVTGTREGEEIPDPFAINKAIAKTSYYYEIYGRQYFYTIHEQDLKRAFYSADGLGNLVSAIMQALKNGENYDDYRMTVALIARQIEVSSENTNWKGKVPLLTLFNQLYGKTLTPENCLQDMDFLKFVSNQFKKWSNRLAKPRQDLNNAGVINWIPKDKQRIMMLQDIQADIDTNLMAWAYNENRLQIGAIDEIECWYSIGATRETGIVKPDDIVVKGDLGLEGETPVIAVIYDPDMLKIYTKTRITDTIRNPRGNYYNIFDTLEDIFACSPFHNFVAFTLE